jgi:hypothetical protein
MHLGEEVAPLSGGLTVNSVLFAGRRGTTSRVFSFLRLACLVCWSFHPTTCAIDDGEDAVSDVTARSASTLSVANSRCNMRA